MSDAFPHELQKAAATWPKYSIANAQLRAHDRHIQVHLQALQIMWQFVGSVEYERDPLGLLFYYEGSDFEVGEANFKVAYLAGSPGFTTVRIDFYVPDSTAGPFSAWLARVDSSRLPPESSRMGSGRWKPLEALTSGVLIYKASRSHRVRLRFWPLRKQLYFNVTDRDFDVATHSMGTAVGLQDITQFDNPSRIDYGPDRFVIFRDGRPEDVISLIIPFSTLPIKLPSGTQAPVARWEALDPNGDALDLHELAAEYKIEGLENVA